MPASKKVYCGCVAGTREIGVKDREIARLPEVARIGCLHERK
jgi:hypothetical protein